MTAFQLEPSAQEPCSSTIVGLGPPLQAAREVVACAEGSWLAAVASAAVARITAITMTRSLVSCAARVMFMSLSSRKIWLQDLGAAVPVQVIDTCRRGCGMMRPG